MFSTLFHGVDELPHSGHGDRAGVSDSGRVGICYRLVRIAYVGAASVRPTEIRESPRVSWMECDIYIYIYLYTIYIYIYITGDTLSIYTVCLYCTGVYSTHRELTTGLSSYQRGGSVIV